MLFRSSFGSLRESITSASYRSSTCCSCCASSFGSAVVASAIATVVVVVGADVVEAIVVVVVVTASAVVIVVSGSVGTVPPSLDELQLASASAPSATPAAVRRSRIGRRLGNERRPKQSVVARIP